MDIPECGLDAHEAIAELEFIFQRWVHFSPVLLSKTAS